MKTLMCILALGIFANIGSGQESDSIEAKNPFPPYLYFLGTVKKTSYFSNNVPMTWYDGHLFCKNNGMQMARIKTAKVQSLLVDKGNDTLFAPDHGSMSKTFFWIAARDARAIQQFRWEDGTNVKDLGQSFYTWDNPQTGLVYIASETPVYNGKWASFDLDNTFRVICESV